MESVPIALEYKASLCEVRSKSNDTLAIGVLGEIGEDYVNIVAKNGDYLTLLNTNTPVKINVHNTKLGFTVLIGSVLTSTENELKVVDVVRVVDHERRNHFRVEVELPAKVSNSESFDSESGTTDVHVVFIRDLSLSGTRIETNQLLENGKKMWIRFNMDGTILMAKLYIVRRMTDKDKNTYQYGCELVYDNPTDNDRLCAYLFRKQRENARKSRPF